MIAFVEGEIVDIEEDAIVVMCGGIGYNIQIPAGSAEILGNLGERCRVFTHMYVREDAIGLYGFVSKDDLLMFRQLISVSGIGPKSALGMLSVMSADEIRVAIISEDIKSISKAPGIGAKSAKRLIVELKDKIDAEDVLAVASIAVPAAQKAVKSCAASDVIMALTALGYSNSEAMRAVRSVEGAELMDEEALLKAALKKMMLF